MSQQITEIPHLAVNQGLCLTMPLVNNNNQTTMVTELGIGQFEPEEEYPPMPTNLPETFPFLLPTLRNCGFIICPSQKQAIMFSNKFPEINILDHNQEENIKKIKYRIFKAIEKIIKFNIEIPGVFGYMVLLDSPDKAARGTAVDYYHQDLAATNVISENVVNALRNLQIISGPPVYDPRYGRDFTTPLLCDYLCLEFGRECVSTQVRNRVIKGDIIRFFACPGTVICVENKSQFHSPPFHTTLNDQPITIPGVEYLTPNRLAGNDMLSNQKIGDPRRLYRTTFWGLPFEKVKNLIKGLVKGTDYYVVNFTEDEWAHIMSMRSFALMPMEEYISTPDFRRIQEAGKKIKKKQKRKNTKRKSKNIKRKSRKSKNIKRKSRKSRKSRNKLLYIRDK